MAILLICFFLSGSLGLIYEIIWIRKLGLIFGTTVFAVTTVLSAFFGGLALGSFAFGKLSKRVRNPVRIYAYLEFVIGIFALLFPVILRLFGWFYSILYPHIYQSFFLLTSIRFIIFALLLVIPATMMGGTLPILSKYFIRSSSNTGGKLAILYGLNTTGAAAGACLCGFYFIRIFGVNATNYLAGIVNIVLASVVYFLSKRLIMPSPAEESNTTDTPVLKPCFQYSDILACFFLSGFASIGYEVVWTRYLSLPLANTRYTYTIILTVFLLGTALGSIAFARFFDRVKNGIRFFGYLEIGIGFFAFLLVPLVYLIVAKVRYSLFIFDFLACGALMLIPTILMGATFPIIVKILTADIGLIGYSTGRVYAINTLGCIFGSLAAGFLLIPALGIKLSLNILVAINFLIGFFCLFRGSNKKWVFNGIAAGVTVLAFIIIHIFLNVRIPEDFLAILKKPSEEITFVKEGLENTVWVTVNQQNQQKSIWANQTVLGRTLAKEPYEVSPQIIAGHIPMLLHRSYPEDILGICLGTGQTFGSILSYNIKRMDVVEISRAIVDIALEQFKNYNANIADDRRVNIIVEDGRNFVAHTRNTYDLITLEPSPPEEAGIVNLYTKEFYQFCKRRLNINGVMSQWLPIYNTHPDETARIIKTFISVFPDSVLWYNSTDLMLLGFNGKIQMDVQKIESSLKNINLNVSYLGNTEYKLSDIENFLAGFLMGPEELQKYSSSVALITDSHPDLEYTFLKYESLENKSEWLEIYNTEKIEQYITPLHSYFSSIPEERLKRIEGIRAKYVSHLYAGAYFRLALAKSGESLDEAIKFCKKALEYNPSYSIVYGNLGAYYYMQNKLSESLSAYKSATMISPDLPELWYMLGNVYWSAGKSDEAIGSWRRAVEINPDFSEAYNSLGAAYTASGQYNDAIEALKKAIRIRSDYADAYYNLGLAYEATSQLAKAISAYKDAIKINFDHVEAITRLKNIITE